MGSPRRTVATIVACVTLAVVVSGATRPAPSGRLDAEITHWERFLRDHSSTDALWTQIRDSSGPGLARARQALTDGRALLALNRLASVRPMLAASSWVAALPARDSATFEAEWARMDRSIAPPSASALEGVRPAALRAIGEAALPQSRIFHEASLEYGRNTMAAYGLLYLGAAVAQRTFVSLVRELSETSAPPPALPERSFAPEIEALRSEMLAVYKPPLSIDRHAEFISAHSVLKEAAELDEAGLRHGALLRLLQASLRFEPLRGTQPSLTRPELDARLARLARTLDSAGVDHSVGRLFLEAAQAELAGAAPDSSPPVAAAIAADVLPRYLAALSPATPAPPRAPPQVTVTLVRWPYT